MLARTCLAVSLALAAQLAANPAEKLAWMSGCWTLTNGALTIEEHWSKPAAGNLLGWSRTVKDGKLVFHEYMRIEQRGDTLVYHARIGPNSAGTPFELKQAAADTVTFENAAHDFPQRLIYRRTATGVHARIEGNVNGKARAQDFHYQRTACE